MIYIGCPVSKREWILDRWFDHTEEAVACAGMGSPLSYNYIFAVDPHWDEETYEIIMRRAPHSVIVEVAEARMADLRVWTEPRKEYMAVLRNWILEKVRALGPECYLSLDSDVLLHPDAIASMLNALGTPDRYDAVGGKCYMSPLPQGPAAGNPRVGTACPSYLTFGRAGTFRRRDVEVPSLISVDCIMAIKMMTPRAYAVDYRYHKHGEDIGWALACRDESVRFGWDARVVNKHVMRREHLDVVDPRCGF